MSGHSKWANIKRQKQANDLVRGNLFSKLSRAITLAVIEGGGVSDPEHNVRLRLAVEKAHELNMPKENIQRAMEKGTGSERTQLKEVVYEAFGPAGSVFIILATADNLNRTLSEIRSILERHEGKLGHKGSVLYLFKKCAVVIFKKSEIEEGKVLSFSEEMNAFDIDEDETHFSVYIPYENLGRIKDHIHDLKYETAEVDFKPITPLPIPNEGNAKKIVSLVNALEQDSDVQKVFTNADIPAHLLT